MSLHGGERLRRVCEGNYENKHPLSAQQPFDDEIDHLL